MIGEIDRYFHFLSDVRFPRVIGKTTSLLHNIRKRCENFSLRLLSRYVLKMDDDIMVDVFQLLQKLKQDFPTLKTTLLGFKQMGLTPQRNPKSKWFVDNSDFGGKTYPDFLSGWAWTTSLTTAEKLVEASQTNKFFWIDDVWVTGMLAKKIGASLETLNSLYTIYIEHIRCCVENQKSKDGKTLMCDFLVGPSMDDFNLIRRYGQLASKCFQEQCERRTWEQSVMKTCVKIDNPLFLPTSPGVGQVFILKNKL